MTQRHTQTETVETRAQHNMTSPSLRVLVCNRTWPLAVVRITQGRYEAPSMRPGARASWQGPVASSTDLKLREACLLPKPLLEGSNHALGCPH